MERLDMLYLKMMDFDAGDPGRIGHFTKVHSFAALIGRLEGLDAATQQTLEAAAYVHDIGIGPAMARYGSGDGKYQEELGPEYARMLLSECGFDAGTIERVAYLVGHHHTYDHVDGADYRILIEADFLVNLSDGGCSREAVLSAYNNIFRTEAGKQICRIMFGL